MRLVRTICFKLIPVILLSPHPLIFPFKTLLLSDLVIMDAFPSVGFDCQASLPVHTLFNLDVFWPPCSALRLWSPPPPLRPVLTWPLCTSICRIAKPPPFLPPTYIPRWARPCFPSLLPPRRFFFRLLELTLWLTAPVFRLLWNNSFNFMFLLHVAALK